MKEIKAVILDRDGVINFDSPDYILTPEQWQPIPGSLEAVARLSRAGIPVAIASNQSALARGMLDETTFAAIHEKMMAAITAAGGKVACVAYCPHGPDDACMCRKPRPGLILECLQQMGLSDQPESALLIGDSVRDIAAAKSAGVRAMLVQSGYGDAMVIHREADTLQPGIRTEPDLAAAVDVILGSEPC